MRFSRCCDGGLKRVGNPVLECRVINRMLETKLASKTDLRQESIQKNQLVEDEDDDFEEFEEDGKIIRFRQSPG